MGATTIGDVAPDFSQSGTRVSGGAGEQADFRLSKHRGSPVVLAFSDAAPESLAGWDGLAADVWAFGATDAPPGYSAGVYLLDPAGILRWAKSGAALPSASEIGAQLLVMMPGPIGGTFNLAPPPS